MDTDAPTAPTAIETVKTADTAITVKATGGTDTTSEVVGYKYSTDNTNWSETVTAGEGYSINYASVNTVNNTWDTKKVSIVVGEGTRKAPIPAGYTVSGKSTESTISQGLVIYQSDARVLPVIYSKSIDAVGNESEVYTLDNRTIYNQYVWIPVDDINDMVMCKSNGTAGTGGSTCNLVYEVSTNHITCNTHGYTTATALTDENIDSIGLAGRLYGISASTTDTVAPYIYTTNMAFTDASKEAHRFKANSTDSDSKFREPDLVTTYDKDDVTTDGNTSNDYMALAGVTSANALKHQLNNKFIEMAKSVAKYGGFYVARYEAGSNGASLKNQKVLVAGTSGVKNQNPNTFIKGNTWYGMYYTLMSSTAVDKTAVNSHMIWGCQYDMIIRFLSENSKNEPQIGHPTRQLDVQKLTGETTTDIMSNIYDLEGNNMEWTVQANYISNRISRGCHFGSVTNYSNFCSASHRGGYYPTDESCYFASRSVLYVK